MGTLKNLRFKQPAEWESHESCWLAWPSAADLWEENLADAQKEFRDLCFGICDVDPSTNNARGESLHILVPNEERQKEAEKALQALPVTFHRIPFGDIWLRDIAPIFVKDEEKKRIVPQEFANNGWGGKYLLEHDNKVSERIAQCYSFRGKRFSYILEGGSLEIDGEGTCLTTRQCLLNPNRNPKMDEKDLGGALEESLGVTKLLWLEEGLLNDHTDGHIDTLARFVRPGVVMCMSPATPDDPNAKVLRTLESDLKKMSDARGRRLEVLTVPSPGKIIDDEGEVMPASYMNFYIANSTVIVPTYGSSFDSQAVELISKQFPNRKTIGLSAKAILSGGGAFHCITQQEPKFF